MGERLAQANTRIEAVAAELGTASSPIRIAVTDAEFTAETDTWDGVHPNTRGELRIAAAFADALGYPYPRPLPDPPTPSVPAAARQAVEEQSLAEVIGHRVSSGGRNWQPVWSKRDGATMAGRRSS
jgi:hypothetical protein